MNELKKWSLFLEIINKISIDRDFFRFLDYDKFLIFFRYKEFFDINYDKGDREWDFFSNDLADDLNMKLAESLFLIKEYDECISIIDSLYKKIKTYPLDITKKSLFLIKIINFYYKLNLSDKTFEVLEYCINESIYYNGDYYDAIINSEKELIGQRYHCPARDEEFEEGKAHSIIPAILFIYLYSKLVDKEKAIKFLTQINDKNLSKTGKEFFTYILHKENPGNIFLVIEDYLKLKIKSPIRDLIENKNLEIKFPFKINKNKYNKISKDVKKTINFKGDHNHNQFPHPFTINDKISLKKMEENEIHAWGPFGDYKGSSPPHRGQLLEEVAIKYIKDGYYFKAINIMGQNYKEHRMHYEINDKHCLQYLAYKINEDFKDLKISNYFSDYKKNKISINNFLENSKNNNVKKIEKNIKYLLNIDSFLYIDTNFRMKYQEMENHTLFKYYTNIDFIECCESIEQLINILETINKLDFDLLAKLEIQIQILEKINSIDDNFDINEYYNQLINTHTSSIKIIHLNQIENEEEQEELTQKYHAHFKFKPNEIDSDGYPIKLVQLADENSYLKDKILIAIKALSITIVSLIRVKNIERFNKAVIWLYNIGKKENDFIEYYFGTLEREFDNNQFLEIFTESQKIEIMNNFNKNIWIEKKKIIFNQSLKNIRGGIYLFIYNYYIIKKLMKSLYKNFSLDEKWNLEGKSLSHFARSYEIYKRYIIYKGYLKKKNMDLNYLLKYLIKYEKNDCIEDIKSGKSWNLDYWKEKSLEYPSTLSGDYYYYDLLIDLYKYTDDDSDINYVNKNLKYIPSFYLKDKLGEKITKLSPN